MNISSSDEEISVDESNDSNNNFPDDLFNVLYGESPPRHGGVQDGQQHREKSGGVQENELYDKSLHDDEVEDEGDRDNEEQQDQSFARLGKTLCLKAKGNDCGKRRGIEIRETGTRKRTRRVITNPTETTKKKTQQKRSINEERKRRKGRSSHQMVFDFTFYTDSV